MCLQSHHFVRVFLSQNHLSFSIHLLCIRLSTVCCDSQGNGCCDNWDGDVTMCGRTQPDGSPLDQSQQSFVFWTARMISVDNSSTPNVSITICTPSYEIWRNVDALVDINSKVLL